VGADAFQIGPWTFVSGSHEIVSQQKSVALEFRTAAVLELLCRNRGQTVARDAIHRAIWGDRQVSANSVPVIMSDLRRALEDDAKNPKYLQTIAKSGYRLLPESTPQGLATRAAGWRMPAVLAAVTVAVATAGFVAEAMKPGVPTLLVSDTMPNQTGQKSFDPLARSTAALIVSMLAGSDQYRLVRASEQPASSVPGIRLTSKLVMWDDQPDVVLTALDEKSSRILWSSHSWGPEETLPRKLEVKLREFQTTLAHANNP
jgi:DNA-binding winged helix-turn-helix (wHTH) protein